MSLSPLFHATAFTVAVFAGIVASMSGFGIGSLLTPLFAGPLGLSVAVAAVSIPHFVGTALRFSMLRAHVDRRVLRRFGALSAAGGLLGALLQRCFGASGLTLVFGAVLCSTGLFGVSGLSRRVRFGRATAWVAGMLSGLLGGLVGNQGGIRTGALLGFDVSKDAFVATSTAVGLIVDGARMPVYLWTTGAALEGRWPLIVTAAAGVSVGTIVGRRALARLTEAQFRRAVSLLVLALGAYMLWKGAAGR